VKLLHLGSAFRTFSHGFLSRLENPVHPLELLATIYHSVGISQAQSFTTTCTSRANWSKGKVINGIHKNACHSHARGASARGSSSRRAVA
jgi:hypothetical protein